MVVDSQVQIVLHDAANQAVAAVLEIRRNQGSKNLKSFCGPLQKQARVLVTVQVLGEGINIPNADTCLFVEPRQCCRSIVQAVGRVLRRYPSKHLAHVILPAVVVDHVYTWSMLAHTLKSAPVVNPQKMQRNLKCT